MNGNVMSIFKLRFSVNDNELFLPYQIMGSFAQLCSKKVLFNVLANGMVERCFSIIFYEDRCLKYLKISDNSRDLILSIPPHQGVHSFTDDPFLIHNESALIFKAQMECDSAFMYSTNIIFAERSFLR